uniref:Uncharacterized protein n=1 Tax=Anguilla anguilla TaxID=7936 RepID=A0A0E9Q8D5_ANGAN
MLDPQILTLCHHTRSNHSSQHIQYDSKRLDSKGNDFQTLGCCHVFSINKGLQIAFGSTAKGAV